MRWVFLGAVAVPVHPKSGITERQIGALWSNGRLPAHLTAHDGDKWRMLPTECTHISNSITQSQHWKSYCQSGFPIYANRSKSANSSIHSHSVICLFLHQGFMHSFISGILPLFCVWICVHLWDTVVLSSFAVFLLWCYDWQKKKSLWWRISHIPYSYSLYQT